MFAKWVVRAVIAAAWGIITFPAWANTPIQNISGGNHAPIEAALSETRLEAFLSTIDLGFAVHEDQSLRTKAPTRIEGVQLVLPNQQHDTNLFMQRFTNDQMKHTQLLWMGGQFAPETDGINANIRFGPARMGLAGQSNTLWGYDVQTGLSVTPTTDVTASTAGMTYLDGSGHSQTFEMGLTQNLNARGLTLRTAFQTMEQQGQSRTSMWYVRVSAQIDDGISAYIQPFNPLDF